MDWPSLARGVQPGELGAGDHRLAQALAGVRDGLGVTPGLAQTATAARGEVWLVDFGTPIVREQGYRRPAVVISADRLNSGRSGLVIVVPCTTAHRALPTHVRLDPGSSGLRETSYAKAEDIKSVSTDGLLHRLGAAPAGELAQLTRIVELLLGM